MNDIEIIFWTLLFLVFYTYLGYGIVLFIFVKIKGLFVSVFESSEEMYEPNVTLFVAAYNEKDCIDEKVKNMRELNYPAEKMQILFVTDGSDDGTYELLKEYEGITVLHENARGGKIGA
ncbi:glycosyltransferase, partial [Flavobacteriales bacterium]|nr:glycosyltransferase [Flavobacteriales bacterium]